MRHLYIDPIGGLSGDMVLSALMDLGANPKAVGRLLSRSLGKKIPLEFESVSEGALSGKRLKAHPSHRVKSFSRFPEVQRCIRNSAFSKRVKEDVITMYGMIYHVEASIHGGHGSWVHLHELACLDTFLDLAGVALSLEMLDIDSFDCGPIPTGFGTIVTQHGPMPIPAPATAALLKGLTIFPGHREGECTTPTGALIASYYLQKAHSATPMILEKSGMGFGQRKNTMVPNGVRLFLGRPDSSEEVYEVKATLDDITGQLSGHLLEKLMEIGALDVTLHPVVMKKSRPGIVVEVLCRTGLLGSVARTLFEESPTIGLRYQRMGRMVLDRKLVQIKTAFGKIPIKCSYYEGKLLQASPEFDALEKLALSKKIPIKELLLKIQSEIQSLL